MVPAAPHVRRLARELGIDVTEVEGSGPGGRITRDDVKAHVKRRGVGGSAAGGAAVAEPALPDFSAWGPVRREAMTTIRRKTAENLSRAWRIIPHVTQFDEAEVSRLLELRRAFAPRAEARGTKLTITAIVLRAVAGALRAFPKFNASVDTAASEIVFKESIHLGVAVDTPKGLLVPVVRDADTKSILTLAEELADLSGRAREGKLELDEMRGATFSVSNLGGLGTTHFSPIVNWPEVAILGLGRATERLVLEDEDIAARSYLPLSLSYDHRLIDGADAARFLRWLAEALEEPAKLVFE
jgi:pyruvate dehydrogenase E2 component (dihydrolipoamide acetyltransferase)